MLDSPANRALEDLGPVVVHPEHERPVDHHAQVTQSPRHLGIVTSQVLVLVAGTQVRRAEGLESDEQAAQACLGGPFDEVAPQD